MIFACVIKKKMTYRWELSPKAIKCNEKIDKQRWMIKEAWIYAYEFVSNNDEFVCKLWNIDTGISYWSSGYASNEYSRGNVCHDESSTPSILEK